jgi:hypothetical protein
MEVPMPVIGLFNKSSEGGCGGSMAINDGAANAVTVAEMDSMLRWIMSMEG